MGNDNGCVAIVVGLLLAVLLFWASSWFFSVLWAAVAVPRFGAPDLGVLDSACVLCLLGFVRGSTFKVTTKNGGAS